MFEQLRARITSADLVRLGSSVVLALLFWGWVTTREDPETTRPYPNVEIDVGELQDGLVVISVLPEALVRVTGPRSVVTNVSSDEVSAHLDLEGIDEPGTYNVSVVVSAPDGVWSRRATPAQVQIEVDRAIAKQFPVETRVQGEVGANRRIGQILPEQTEATVRGPESIVGRVARVVLPITIGEETRDFVGAFTPIAEDQDGQQIAEVTVLPNPITTTVEIEAAGKSIAVFTQLVGSPAPGLDILDRTVNPSTVLVNGPKELLDEIVGVQTLPVDISDADSNISRRIGLQDLPEGVNVVDPSDGQVEVFVQIGERGVRQVLPGIAVGVANLGSGLNVTVTPVNVSVVVLASSDNLARLTANDIMIQVDLTGLGPGEYEIRPTISLPPNVQWISTNPPSVTITIAPAGATESQASPVATPLVANE